MTEHIIYKTNLTWLGNIRGLPNTSQLNFWRGLRRGLRLVAGSTFYFRPQGSDSVEGGARFVDFSTQKLSIAWDKWSRGNGASSFEEFQTLARKVLRLDGADPLIGCAILTMPFFFARPYPVIPAELGAPAQMPFRYFTYVKWPAIEKATVA